MNEEQSIATIRIPGSMYLELVKLLESRVRSERARANAFRRLEDLRNAYDAELRRQQYQSMRDALVAGCLPEGGSDV